MKSRQIENQSDLQAFETGDQLSVLKIMDPWSDMDGFSYALLKGFITTSR